MTTHGDGMDDISKRAEELHKQKARERRAANLNLTVTSQATKDRRASHVDGLDDNLENNERSNTTHYAIYDHGHHDAPKDIFDAAEEGHLDALKEFSRDSDFEPDLTDRFGRTALMIAAEAGYTKFVEDILNLGANPLVADKHNKRTAIHWAARMGQVGCLQAIVAKIPESQREDAVNAEDAAGSTPVFLASQRGGEGEKAVQDLLMNGARYNSTKISVKTAGNVIRAGIRMKRMMGGLGAGLKGNPAPEVAEGGAGGE